MLNGVPINGTVPRRGIDWASVQLKHTFSLGILQPSSTAKTADMLKRCSCTTKGGPEGPLKAGQDCRVALLTVVAPSASVIRIIKKADPKVRL